MENEIILYQSDELPLHLEVRLDEENETFWLSLNQIAQLFERDKSVVSRHLKNIFKENELDKNSVVAFFATTASDGKTYNVEYNKQKENKIQTFGESPKNLQSQNTT